MNLLIQLLLRIAGGERLEKGLREDTAWWLGALVAVMMGSFAWFEKSGYSHLLDTMAGIVGMVVMMVIVLAVLQAVCVRMFRRLPLWRGCE